MATKYPLILNSIRFQVNPTNLRISKPLVTSQLATQAGIRYQVWYDSPEVLTINGISAGSTAYQELLFLKQNYEQSSTGGISTLYYKTKGYRGFIRRLDVAHSIDQFLRFPYTIDFQLVNGEKFNIHDFALEPSGAFSALSNSITQVINQPINNLSSSLNGLLGKVA